MNTMNPGNRKKLIIFALFIYMAALSLSSDNKDGQASRTEQVLILHSYHRLFPWTENIMTGILSEFDRAAVGLELSVEYMDTKRHPPERLYPLLSQLYQGKYGESSFDVLICTDNNALDFVLQYRSNLFPGIPVVFAGINNFSNSLLWEEDLREYRKPSI